MDLTINGNIIFLFLFLIFCINVYIVTAGADLGMGICHLLSPRYFKREFESTVLKTFAPLWEVNHVWLIAVIVILFVNFPKIISTLATALNIPLTLFVFALICRGVSFAFIQYIHPQESCMRTIWKNIYGYSSIVSLFLLGVLGGAIIGGDIPVHADISNYLSIDFIQSWVGIVPCLVGLISIFFLWHLGAVFNYFEAKSIEVKAEFHSQSFWSFILFGICSFALYSHLIFHGSNIFYNLIFKSWSSIWLALSMLACCLSFWGLVTNRLLLTLIGSISKASILIWGFALAMTPYLHTLQQKGILPDRIFATDATTNYSVWVWIVGSALLLPSLGYLYYVFKKK